MWADSYLYSSKWLCLVFANPNLPRILKSSNSTSRRIVFTFKSAANRSYLLSCLFHFIRVCTVLAVPHCTAHGKLTLPSNYTSSTETYNSPQSDFDERRQHRWCMAMTVGQRRDIPGSAPTASLTTPISRALSVAMTVNTLPASAITVGIGGIAARISTPSHLSTFRHPSAFGRQGTRCFCREHFTYERRCVRARRLGDQRTCGPVHQVSRRDFYDKYNEYACCCRA